MKDENKIFINEYIDEICSHIKWKAVHRQIILEIEDHLYGIIEDHQDRGIEEGQAVQKALKQMGKAETIGKQLNETHRPTPDWGTILLVFLLSGIGLLAIYFLQRYGKDIGNYQYLCLGKSIFYIIAGGTIGAILYFVDYRKIQPYSKYIYGATILVFLLVLRTGPLVHGRPYLYIMGQSIDFIAMSPYVFIVSLAGIFARWDWQKPKEIFIGMGLVLLPFVLMVIAPNLVAAFLFLIAALIIMHFSGARPIHLTGLWGGILGIIVLSVSTYPYRLKRLLIFLNPYQDPLGMGYITVRSTEAIRSAGFFGRGFEMENILLPALHTDFIFTYLVYTFGWVAGFAVVALALMFILRLTKLGSVVRDPYGKLVIIGFAVMISLQYVWNILMTLGLAPTVGVGMPFVSYGGLSMVVYFVVIGLISSIYKRRDIGIA